MTALAIALSPNARPVVGAAAVPFALVSISVSSGEDWNNQAVTFTGTSFTGATDAQVGGVSIGSFTVVNSTTITGTVPTRVLTAATELVSATVTNGSTSTLANAYTYSWTPWSLPSILAWYRADKAYTVATPALWGNSSRLTPITGLGLESATPPTNATDAGYNNQNVVAFDGADTAFALSGATGGTKTVSGITVLAVGEPGTGAAYRYVWSADEGGAEVSVYVTPTGEVAFYNVTEVATVATWSGKQAIACVFNGASSKLYLSQKTSPTTGAATAPAAIADTSFAVGAYYAALATPWKGTGGTGKLPEVVVTGAALSEANVGLFMDYAAARYTITVAP